MLPALLPNWRLERFADGVGLVPPGGRVLGGIRIRERLRPLRPLAYLFREATADLALADLGASPLEPFVTAEGEYAGCSTLTGTHDGVPMERTLAFVLGDECYTRIDGITAVPARFAGMRALVREVARLYALGLGELRQRRYLYAPPAGWGGYPRGLATEWYPPGAPADSTCITVYPARALLESLAGEHARAVHELGWTGFAGRVVDDLPLATPTLASGLVRHYEGTRGGETRHVLVAVLQDARFAYTCRLDTAHTGHIAAFYALTASIAALPAPGREATPAGAAAAGAFEHWQD